jgi:hypothetical protein
LLQPLLPLLSLYVSMQAKARDLKQNLNNEFRSIHELCMFVLANTRKVELLRATLTALAAYLSWIPPGGQACSCLSGTAACRVVALGAACSGARQGDMQPHGLGHVAAVSLTFAQCTHTELLHTVLALQATSLRARW